MQRTVPAIPWPLPSGLADSLCQGQPDSLAHRLTACVRGDVSRDSLLVWAAGADDGWVSFMLCSWDTTLCCTLENVLSEGALGSRSSPLSGHHLPRAFSIGLLCAPRIVSQSFAEFLPEPLFSFFKHFIWGEISRKTLTYNVVVRLQRVM